MTHDTQRAWYTGDREMLRRATDGFWRTNEARKVHVPVARMLSQISAGLLFSGSPTVGTPDKTDQILLDEALKQTGFYSKLLQGAELCSAYGGVYLRLGWDRADSPWPSIFVVTPDQAEPTFVQGKLHAVAFTELVRITEQTGVRYYLEQRYEPDGRILNRLISEQPGGKRRGVPLDAIPETAGMEPEAVSGAGVLLACYVPNRLPNPVFSSGMEGASDYEGLESLLQALDEAYTALMRDVRLGKARIIVPMEFLRRKEQLLQRAGSAPGWVFDIDEEVFTALDINPQDSGAGITVAQSAVRAAELEAVIDGLVRRIFITAGYSPQSAGIGELGSAESGTALNIRERLSMQTTESKKTHWWHALNRFVNALWRLTQALHDIPPTSPDFTISFPDNVQPDLASTAEIVKKLSDAGAVSKETMVRMVGPELGEGEVRAEVARLGDAVP